MKRLTFLAVIVSIMVVGMPARPVLSVIDTKTNEVVATVDSAMIPLTGTVGNVHLTGVVHVVTQGDLLTYPPEGFLTVYAYLTPSDVTAVDLQGNEYLAHGAGRAATLIPDSRVLVAGGSGGIAEVRVCVPEFVLVAGGLPGTQPFDALGMAFPHVDVHFFMQLELSMLPGSLLDASTSTATSVDVCSAP